MNVNHLLIVNQGQVENNSSVSMLLNLGIQAKFVNSIEEVDLDVDVDRIAFVRISKSDLSDRSEQLRRFLQRLTVVAIVDRHDESTREACVFLGADAVLHSDFTEDELEEVFQHVLWRRDVQIQKQSMKTHAEALMELTSRERRIVQLASLGEPNKRIASTVGLSVKSIERIRRDAYDKLNVRSAAEMTRAVILGGLYRFDGPDDSTVFVS